MRLPLVVLFALFASACTGKNIATVNTELVYQKSAVSEKATNYLKAVDAELTAELTALQEKSAATAGDKKIAQNDLQKTLMDIQQRFGAEQQQVVNVLNANYKIALEKLCEKYKLDAIFASDMVLSASQAIDMTDKAIEEMNALPVEFSRLTPEKENAEKSVSQ